MLFILRMCMSPKVIGKIGTVVGVGDSGDLRIRYPENTIYILCSESVVKVRVQCVYIV